MDKKKSNQQKSVMKELHCHNCKNYISTAMRCMSDYAYKTQYRGRTIYFCSWNCMRRWQRERGLTPEQLTDKSGINNEIRYYNSVK